jgi:RND family efflux transporter MFP subunit
MKKAVILLAAAIALSARELTLSGVVQSSEQSKIAARSSGFVQKVYVTEGDEVKPGQLLYSVDTSDLDAQKTRTRLQIQQARFEKNMYQNRYEDAKRNYERYMRLYEKEMVAKYELEQMELKMQNLHDLVAIINRRVKQAKASLQAIENRYEHYRVKAPVGGTVVQKNIKPGELAMPGQPAMVISNRKELKLVTKVSQKQMGRIKEGMKATVLAESSGYEGTGVITAVLPAADPASHTFTVKITLDGSESLYPGMYAKAVIEGGQ